jgi:transposase
MAALLAASGWSIVALAADPDGTLRLRVEPTCSSAACPTCGTRSSRCHSRYWRRPRDLPWRGHAVRLEIHVRRLFCDAAICPRRTFAERFDGLVAPRAQRSDGATGLLREIGLRAGGEGGARLARRAGLPTSPDTLLRILRSCGEGVVPTPRVLGVDDFALRRGQRYATILLDLEQRRPIDVLPGRDREPLAIWLHAHPGVQVLVRDRAEAYAQAGRQAAPEAVQVADRFHLVRGASTALEEVLRGRRRRIDVELATPEPGLERKLSRTQQERLRARTRRVGRWQEVRARRAVGASIQGVARALGMHRRTVRRLLATPEPPRNRPPAQPLPAGLASPRLRPFVGYLAGRWQAGCDNVAQLHRELAAQGCHVSYTLVQQALRPWRGPPSPEADGRRRPGRPRHRRYNTRWLCLRPPNQLDAHERVALERLLAEDPEVARGYALLQRFRRLVTERDLLGLDQWLHDARASQLPPFASMANGIQADRAAVEAALTLPWSNGPTEGHNHRVKLLKRAGYGRCSLLQLRARVITAS